MADEVRLSNLPAQETMEDTDLLVVEKSGENDEKITAKNFRNWGSSLFKGNETPQAEAATDTFVAADFDKIITNTGAVGAVVYTLPAASAVKGKKLRIALTVAQQVSLDPVAADAIYLHGDGVDNKDLVIAGVIGNYVDVWSDGDNYLVADYNGVVTKEA